MTNPAFSKQLSRLHRELGIPASYATDRGLPLQSEAEENDLFEVGINDDGGPIRLIRPAAEAWTRMRRAAAREDVELLLVSGFRSVARQTEIFREKLAGGHRLEDILRYVAAPGFSEHHTGRAVDIASPEHIELDAEFAGTAAFRWLESNAHGFRFTLTYPRQNSYGIGFEPWHWCWQS